MAGIVKSLEKSLESNNLEKIAETMNLVSAQASPRFGHRESPGRRERHTLEAML